MSALGSLRLRLLAGTAIIVMVAIGGALMIGRGAAIMVDGVDQVVAVQKHIDLLSALSGRIGDYAVAAVESAAAPTAPRGDRLDTLGTAVETAFTSVQHFRLLNARADLSPHERLRRETGDILLARMRAQFMDLRMTVAKGARGETLRAALDGFAAQFAPLMRQALDDQRRARNRATDRIADLHDLVLATAAIIAVATGALAVFFYIVSLRPILVAVRGVAAAAAQVASGDLNVVLTDTRRDEIGDMYRAVNAMAAALREGRMAVERDRAGLNEIIDERTAAVTLANAQLAAIDRRRRRFFADIGHELRTPLTVILAETELALKDGQAAAHEALRTIRQRAQRLNRRIDDLLRVARSETGRLELSVRPIDLAETAAAAIEDMAPVAKRRGLAVHRDLAPAPAQGDDDWCRQVISGLLENALRHAPSDGHIRVASRDQGAYAEVTVTDDGAGVSAEEAAHVFDRFARGRRETPGSGFGVGLALARWVIGAQSGTLTLKSPAPERSSRPGGRPGTQLVLRLPNAAVAAEEISDG